MKSDFTCWLESLPLFVFSILSTGAPFLSMFIRYLAPPSCVPCYFFSPRLHESLRQSMIAGVGLHVHTSIHHVVHETVHRRRFQHITAVWSIHFVLKCCPVFGHAEIIKLYVNALGGLLLNCLSRLQISCVSWLVLEDLSFVYQSNFPCAFFFNYKSLDLCLFFLQDSQRLVNMVSYIKVLFLLIIVHSDFQRHASSQKKSLSRIWPWHSSQMILTKSLSLTSLQRLLIIHVSEWGAALARRKLDLALVKGCIIGPCSCVLPIGW